MVIAQPRHRAPLGGGRVTLGWRGTFSFVDQDAAIDGMRRWWGRALFWTPTTGFPLLAVIYVVAKWDFYWLLREDHVVEWCQFGFLALACLAGFAAALRFARQGRWFLAILLVLVGVVALGMAGEEISWGQRVVGWSTPADLAQDNRQGETNLHNIDIGVPVQADDIADAVELLMGVGGVVLSSLARPAGSVFHRSVLWDLAPPLATLPGFAWMIVYQVAMRATGTSASPAILVQEWVEFGFYGSIAVTVICVYARAARGRVLLVPASRRRLRRVAPRAPAGLAPIRVMALLVLVLVIVCAVLTTWVGMVPGNVPPSFAG